MKIFVCFIEYRKRDVLGFGEEILDLDQFNLAVSSHLLHANFSRKFYVRRGFGGISKYYTIWINAKLHHLSNLLLSFYCAIRRYNSKI